MLPETPRVLVADADPASRLLLQRALGGAHCEVALADDGPKALAAAQSIPFDLLLLDVLMARMNGLEVCRRVRAMSAVPIVLLTALTSEEDTIRGLDAGADDYVRKPVSTGELLARVRAALRRAQLNAAPQSVPDPPAPPVRTGDLTVDLAHGRTTRDGSDVTLTPIERRLIAHLARHLGRVVTPDQLLTQVWGPEYVGDARLVQVNISRLRRKIEPTPGRPIYIQTLTGAGYMLAPHPGDQA